MKSRISPPHLQGNENPELLLVMFSFCSKENRNHAAVIPAQAGIQRHGQDEK
jgi:hypothetical protein